MKRFGLVSAMLLAMMLVGCTKDKIPASTEEVEILSASEIIETSENFSSPTDAESTVIYTQEDYDEWKALMEEYTELTCLQINTIEVTGVEINRQELDITCDLVEDKVRWAINDEAFNEYDGATNIYYIEKDGEMVENYGNIPVLGFNINNYSNVWEMLEMLIGSDSSYLVDAEYILNNEGYSFFTIDKKIGKETVLGVEYDTLGEYITYDYIFKDGIPVSICATMEYTRDDVTYTARTSLQVIALGGAEEDEE